MTAHDIVTYGSLIHSQFRRRHRKENSRHLRRPAFDRYILLDPLARVPSAPSSARASLLSPPLARSGELRERVREHEGQIYSINSTDNSPHRVTP